MKMYKSLLIIAAMVTSSQAATISFDMAADTWATTAAGVPLTPAYTAYVGKYNGAALTSTATFAQINAGFTSLFSIAFATGDALGAPGYVTTGAINFTDAQGFANQPLYVFYTNGSDQNALITGFGNIPSDAAIPNSVDFGINAANAASFTYVVGSYNAAAPNVNGGGAVVLNAAAVPEPSALLLGAVGALGLLRRRRI
jgi:hypothetical protein